MAEDHTLKMVAEIVSAYVGHNQTPAAHIPDLIRSVHGCLRGLEAGEVLETATVKKPVISLRKSVTPDYLICLEDGRKFKTLKRHLRSTYNMSPEEYRAKWSLPPEYPMVAPNYATRRSNLAKNIGLGRKGRASA